MKMILMTAAALVTAATPARAQESPAVATPVVSAPASARGVHYHDGFYLRIATGFGAYSEGITQKGADQSTEVTGIASAGEIAVGGAIRPGLIIGGGAFNSGVLASDRTVRGATPPPEVIDSRGDFAIVGPFFDYYFEPSGGLHLQGAVGFVTLRGLSVGSGEFDRHSAAVGGGAMVGFGYEWWVSNQWSLGVLGRVMGGVATGTDSTDTRWNHVVGASPSVLFTATYN
jgi:hypothetical protein